MPVAGQELGLQGLDEGREAFNIKRHPALEVAPQVLGGLEKSNGD